MQQTPDNWKTRTLLFFISQCITLFGSQLVQMAIVWHVTLQTSSGVWIAAFSICGYLPQFFISFPGGVLADRFSLKALILGADLLIAAVTLGMMLLMPHIPSQGALLIALLAMSLMRSAGAGIQVPAVQAAVAQLVPPAHLMRYNSINAAMQSFVQFAAPAAAGMVLSVYALREALFIDILTAALGSALLACICLPLPANAHKHVPIRADMTAGAHYACSHAAIRHALIINALFVFLTVPAGYLSGLLVSRIYGNTYGYLTAVELVGFGGMMAGGLLMSLWGGFKSRRQTLAFGLTAFGMMAIGMGFSRSFFLYLLFMAFYGVALTMVQTTLTTMLQENTERSMLGRVFGLMNALYASCYPLGMALFGSLADHLSLPLIMIASGAALMATAYAAYTHTDA